MERRGLVKREHRFPGAGALHQLTLLWLESAGCCAPLLKCFPCVVGNWKLMPEFQQLEQSDIILNRGTKNTQLVTPLLGNLLGVLFFPAFQRKEGEQGLLRAFPYRVEMFCSGAVGKGRLAAQTAGSTGPSTAVRWGLYSHGLCFHSLLLGPFHELRKCSASHYDSRKNPTT